MAATRPTRCDAGPGSISRPRPIVLTVPDTCGRYYALWLMDDADSVFASIGSSHDGYGTAARSPCSARHGTEPTSHPG